MQQYPASTASQGAQVIGHGGQGGDAPALGDTKGSANIGTRKDATTTDVITSSPEKQPECMVPESSQSGITAARRKSTSDSKLVHSAKEKAFRKIFHKDDVTRQYSSMQNVQNIDQCQQNVMNLQHEIQDSDGDESFETVILAYPYHKDNEQTQVLDIIDKINEDEYEVHHQNTANYLTVISAEEKEREQALSYSHGAREEAQSVREKECQENCEKTHEFTETKHSDLEAHSEISESKGIPSTLSEGSLPINSIWVQKVIAASCSETQKHLPDEANILHLIPPVCPDPPVNTLESYYDSYPATSSSSSEMLSLCSLGMLSDNVDYESATTSPVMAPGTTGAVTQTCSGAGRMQDDSSDVLYDCHCYDMNYYYGIDDDDLEDTNEEIDSCSDYYLDDDEEDMHDALDDGEVENEDEVSCKKDIQSTSKTTKENEEKHQFSSKCPSPRTIAITLENGRLGEDGCDIYNRQDEELVEIFNKCHLQDDKPAQSQTEATAEALEALVQRTTDHCHSSQHDKIDYAIGGFDRHSFHAPVNGTVMNLPNQINNNNRNSPDGKCSQEISLQQGGKSETPNTDDVQAMQRNGAANDDGDDTRSEYLSTMISQIQDVVSSPSPEREPDNASIVRGAQTVNTLFQVLVDMCANLPAEKTSDTESDEVRKLHHGVLFELMDDEEKSVTPCSSNPDVVHSSDSLGDFLGVTSDPCSHQLQENTRCDWLDSSDHADLLHYHTMDNGSSKTTGKLLLESSGPEKNFQASLTPSDSGVCIIRSSISANFADDEVDQSAEDTDAETYAEPMLECEHNSSGESYKSTVETCTSDGREQDDSDVTLTLSAIENCAEKNPVMDHLREVAHDLQAPLMEELSTVSARSSPSTSHYEEFGRWKFCSPAGNDDDTDEFVSCSENSSHLHPEHDTKAFVFSINSDEEDIHGTATTTTIATGHKSVLCHNKQVQCVMQDFRVRLESVSCNDPECSETNHKSVSHLDREIQCNIQPGRSSQMFGLDTSSKSVLCHHQEIQADLPSNMLQHTESNRFSHDGSQRKSVDEEIQTERQVLPCNSVQNASQTDDNLFKNCGFIKSKGEILRGRGSEIIERNTLRAISLPADQPIDSLLGKQGAESKNSVMFASDMGDTRMVPNRVQGHDTNNMARDVAERNITSEVKMMNTLKELRTELDEWIRTQYSRKKGYHSHEEDMISHQIAEILPFLRKYCREKQQQDIVSVERRATDHSTLHSQVFKMDVPPFLVNYWLSSRGVWAFLAEIGFSVLVNII